MQESELATDELPQPHISKSQVSALPGATDETELLQTPWLL